MKSYSTWREKQGTKTVFPGVQNVTHAGAGNNSTQNTMSSDLFWRRNVRGRGPCRSPLSSLPRRKRPRKLKLISPEGLQIRLPLQICPAKLLSVWNILYKQEHSTNPSDRIFIRNRTLEQPLTLYGWIIICGVISFLPSAGRPGSARREGSKKGTFGF